MKLHIKILSMLAIGCVSQSYAQDIAYIHGDVAQNGNIPSGNAAPFEQMLLTDTGDRGTSQFRIAVQNEGYDIDQFYDQDTTLNASFLNQFDVIIFGLHQKIWSNSERNALDAWIRNGGGMLIYSDSASGGRFNIVGSDNNVGQTVTNNLISQYGMQVTVDQADGIIANSNPGSSHPVIAGNLILEGEGVSPIAINNNANVEVIVPYTTNVVSGNATLNRTQGITINNPTYAALANATVGDGNVMAMYDRQPMWNNGPGSDINERDNREILLNIIDFLAEGSDNSDPLVTLRKRNNSNFAIDGDNGAANGQNVYLWNFNSNNINQQFIEVDRGNGFFSYIKQGTNHALDGGNGGQRAQNVYLWISNANNFNQHWRKVSRGGGSFQLQKRNSQGFSIDGNNGAARRQNVYLWNSLNNEQNQQWIIQEN